MSAKITGRVAEVLIEEGQRVQSGQVLARLDATDAAAALALAPAQVAVARAELADLTVQQRQAQRDAERQSTLAERHLASAQSSEDAATLGRSLAARLQVQQRQIAVTLSNVEVARVALDNTIVRAPFPGVVTVKAAQPGEIVSPISAGGGFTRTGIGTIVDMDSLEIEVAVNAAYISRVHDGQPVTAHLNAYPDWALDAHVITIIPTADRAKATVKVRIAIATRDARIVPEMGVRVSFLEAAAPAGAASSPPGVLVPSSALMRQGDEQSVWVVSQGRATRRVVRTGQRAGESRLTLAGMRLGERVIRAPPAGLRDGTSVQPGDGD